MRRPVPDQRAVLLPELTRRCRQWFALAPEQSQGFQETVIMCRVVMWHAARARNGACQAIAGDGPALGEVAARARTPPACCRTEPRP